MPIQAQACSPQSTGADTRSGQYRATVHSPMAAMLHDQVMKRRAPGTEEGGVIEGKVIGREL